MAFGKEVPRRLFESSQNASFVAEIMLTIFVWPELESCATPQSLTFFELILFIFDSVVSVADIVNIIIVVIPRSRTAVVMASASRVHDSGRSGHNVVVIIIIIIIFVIIAFIIVSFRRIPSR